MLFKSSGKICFSIIFLINYEMSWGSPSWSFNLKFFTGVYENNGYLMISANGGLNQMRAGVSTLLHAVSLSSFLNMATNISACWITNIDLVQLHRFVTWLQLQDIWMSRWSFLNWTIPPFGMLAGESIQIMPHTSFLAGILSLIQSWISY